MTYWEAEKPSSNRGELVLFGVSFSSPGLLLLLATVSLSAAFTSDYCRTSCLITGH